MSELLPSFRLKLDCMPRLRRELAALNVEMNKGDEDGMPKDPGERETVVLFNTVRYPVLKSLDPKGMIKFMDERED